jgi:hypothetical protein
MRAVLAVCEGYASCVFTSPPPVTLRGALRLSGASGEARAWSAPASGVGALKALLAKEGVEVIETEAAARISLVAEEVLARLKGTGLAPLAHQWDAIHWLARGRWFTEARDRLLGDDMGLGKTVEAACAFPPNPAVVIFCPPAVVGVWHDHLTSQQEGGKGWRADLEVVEIRKRHIFFWPKPGQVVIISWSLAPYLRPALAKAGEPTPGTIMVEDEAQAAKNPGGGTAINKRRVGARVAASGGCRWLLTGTPLDNGPKDLWEILDGAGMALKAFSSYLNFCNVFRVQRVQVNRSGRRVLVFGASPQTSEGGRALRKVMLRRLKTQVLKDLPPISLDRWIVDISKKAAKELNAAVALLTKDGRDLEEAIADALDSQAGTIAFEDMSRLRSALNAAKVPALLGIVEQFREASEPLVVFSPSRAPLDALYQLPGWVRVSGSETSEQKTEAIRRFQEADEGIVGIAVQTQSGGTGITLTRASVGLHVGRPWKPAGEDQANARLWRIGQKRGVRIYSVVADHPVDRAIDAKQNTKRAQMAVVDAAAVEGEVVESKVEPTLTAKPSSEPAPGGCFFLTGEQAKVARPEPSYAAPSGSRSRARVPQDELSREEVRQGYLANPGAYVEWSSGAIAPKDPRVVKESSDLVRGGKVVARVVVRPGLEVLDE